MNTIPPFLKSASLFFDFDSTLISGEAIDELAQIALVSAPDRGARVEKIRIITNAGMEGAMPIDESLRQRLDMLQVRAHMLAPLVARLQQQVSPSVQRNGAMLRAMRDQIWIISSGFHEWIDPVVAALGLRVDHVNANRLLANTDGILKLDPSSRCAMVGSKARAAAALGCAPPRIMIGDGMTDFEVFSQGACEYFAAWTESVVRPAVVSKADIIAPHFEGLLAALSECLA